MKRRLLSAFLAVMMVLTMAPVAFAADEGDTAPQSSVSLPANNTGDFTISEEGAVLDGAGVTYKNGTITVTAADVTIKNLTFGDKAKLVVNTSGKFTLTGCTFTPETVCDNATKLPVRTAVTLNVGEAEVTNNTFGGITNGYYNAIEFGIGASNNDLSKAVISGNTFNSAIRNNYFNFYNMTPNAQIDIVNNKLLLAEKSSNGIRISNFRNATGVTFKIDSDEYTYAADSADSVYEGLILLQDYSKGSDVQNFSGITINVTKLSAPKSAKQLLYVYDDHTQSIITTNQPKLTGDDSLAQFYAAKIGDTYYKTLADAVAAAQSGETVKLLANINGQTVIPADKNIVLDLNGKTMTHTGTTLYNSGTLVVKDSSADKSGKIVSTGNVGIGVNHNSTTTIEYANIQAQEGAVITGYATGATITIEDGVFTALDNAVVAGNGNKTDKNTEGTPERVNANKITINGGTFTGNIQSSGYIACGIYAPWKDIITVNGGDFTVNNGIGIVARAGQVTVNGGRFICNGSAKGKVGDKKFDMDAAQILYFDASNPAYPAYNSATDYIKVTGGLFAAAFNNAYCADGKAVVPNTDAATKDVYPYTVGTVEENVEVSPAAPEAKAETTGKETTVADAMTSIAQNIQNNGATTEGLEAVGGQEANKVTTDEVTAAKTELAKTVSVADKTVTVYVQPYLDITVKDAKVSADNENAPYSVTLDIVPMVKKVASTAENADAIALSGNNKNAVVLENKEVTVTTPVTITIKLPDNFAISDVSTIKVKHEKNGVLVGYHDATVDKENRTVTFTNDKGFSTFTILSDSRSTSISFDGEAAVSYGPSNVNDALPTKTAPSGKVFKGWSFEGVNGTYTTLTDDLLTALDGKTAVKATSVFDNKSSGGSSGSSSGKTTYKVTTSAVNNGGVNASPSNAEKGATITITLSPDKGYKLDKLTVTDGSGKSVSTVKKSDTVYTFTMPASAVKVGVSYVKATETPSKTTFNDVSANDWFASAVDYVTGKGMMNGTAANTFSPKANTTRGMLMTVLARHAGEDTTGGSVWYEKGMNWAKANGVSDGTNPQVNITREQLAAMLYRYAQNKKYDVSGAKSLDGYTDAQSVSSYAVPALQWANAAGVVTGKSGSKLDPKGYATRAEVAAMLMRFCENVEK